MALVTTLVGNRVLRAAIGAARRVGKWRIRVANEMIVDPDKDELSAGESTVEGVESVVRKMDLAGDLGGGEIGVRKIE